MTSCDKRLRRLEAARRQADRQRCVVRLPPKCATIEEWVELVKAKMDGETRGEEGPCEPS